MNRELLQRLADLALQLSDAIGTAANRANEIRAVIRAELEREDFLGPSGRPYPRRIHRSPHLPLVDTATFSVMWAGRTCRLGHTILFRLAACLACQPDRYIPADELLHDVWEGDVKSPNTIRSAVRHLRGRLCGAGMKDLAASIHGTGGSYGLILDRVR